MATARGIILYSFLLCSFALVSSRANAGYHPRVGRGQGGVAQHGGRGRGSIPGETIFNVLQYGAKPGGKKDSTEAFMKAWVAACHWRGKARLLIPQGIFLIGQVTFQGPCNSPTPIIVQVAATLKAVTDISEFASPEWVTFEDINGLIVTGGGTFDGQGDVVWKYNDCRKNSNCQLLPTSIKFNSITNGNLRGINSVNAKSFHIAMNRCQNFRAFGLHIIAPEDSPNTDGIHISSSNFVKVSKSIISTGDDCISIGQGSTNISINKVTCGPGHGISIGSLGKYPDEKDVMGIIVKNSTLMNTDNGLRIKTWPGSPPSQASGILFQDIIMKNVKNPIIIDQLYCPSGSSCRTQPSRVRISNIHYRNIRGTSSSPLGVNLMCSPQFPCQNVELFDINLRYSGKRRVSTLTSSCSNVKAGFGGVQIPPPCR
ncbi:exopolygalacturonase-like [Vitis riparia]|uniref:exopolygalacturonase-like n=1 Tax=Vitis riparia TaxID=96939 RepID=UPI00155A2EAE|nr:exopolygalacturonase-like [Vitis riparia]